MTPSPPHAARLIGHEAIGVVDDQPHWVLRPAGQLRVLVPRAGRQPPTLVLTVEGARFETTESRPQLYDRVLELTYADLSIGDTGTLEVHWDAESRSWPVKIMPGRDDSAANGAFDTESGTHRGSKARYRATLSAACRWRKEQTSAVERMWGLFFAARVARAANDWDAAIALWRAAADAAGELGVPSWRGSFLRAAAFVALHNLWDLGTAQDLLDEAETHTPAEDYVGHYRGQYSLGLLAIRAGDPLRAAAHIDRAIEEAMHLGESPATISSVRSGLQTIDGEAADIDEVEGPIAEYTVDAVALRVNRSWTLLMLAVQHRDLTLIERALTTLGHARSAHRGMQGDDLTARIALNLAWARSLGGELGRARAELMSIDHGQLDPAIRYEAGLLLARIHLAFGEVRVAINDLTELRRHLARLDPWTLFHIRAGVSQSYGQALAATGKPEAALEVFHETLDSLDVAVRRFSVSQRSTFLGRRTPLFDAAQLIDDTIDIVTQYGSPAEAVLVVERALSRSRDQLWQRCRVDLWPPDKRDAWLAHEAELSRLEAETMRGRRARRLTATERDDLLGRLGRAMRHAWEQMRTLLAEVDGRERPPPSLDDVSERLAPTERVLVEWIRADGTARRWWLSPGGCSACDGTPLETLIADAEHLYLVTSPRSRLWDELPDIRLGDDPLMTRMSISFLPSLASLMDPISAMGERPIVIADPRHDLPQAADDGPYIANLLGGDLLAGRAATRKAVLSAAKHPSVFHFSGHGERSSGTEDAAELQLGRRSTLRAEEIVLAGLSANVVVLNGCSTGQGFSAHMLSLPAAFLAAGSGQVLATTRPVLDDEASRFIRDFYDLGGARAPGRALAQASARAYARGSDIWSAYRLIGARPSDDSAPDAGGARG